MKICKKFKKEIFKYNKSKGFTLVETLVAVLILTISLAALLNLVSTSLSTFKYSRDDVTANYLIQEVVDSVRNKRDSLAFLGDGTWTNFISHYGNSSNSSGCFSEAGCNLDVLTDLSSNNEIPACSNNVSGDSNSLSACPYLYLNENSSGSYYSTEGSAGKQSIFKRKINMVEKNNELDVTVTVDWDTERQTTRSRALTFSLLNWR